MNDTYRQPKRRAQTHHREEEGERERAHKNLSHANVKSLCG